MGAVVGTGVDSVWPAGCEPLVAVEIITFGVLTGVFAMAVCVPNVPTSAGVVKGKGASLLGVGEAAGGVDAFKLQAVRKKSSPNTTSRASLE